MQITTLASSSSGNCSLVSEGDTHILIDAGISFKRIKLALCTLGIEPRDLSGVLVTHSHGDHVKGLQTFTKHVSAPIFATEQTLSHVAGFAAPTTELCPLTPGEVMSVGDMSFYPFCTSHDAPGSVGFAVTNGTRKLVFATDLGIVTQQVYDAAVRADLAVIESNHDLQMLKCGFYPPPLKRRIMSDRGHLSNLAGATFALDIARTGARKIILAHLSHENNTPRLAYECARERFEKAGAELDGDVTLAVAPRDEVGETYIV